MRRLAFVGLLMLVGLLGGLIVVAGNHILGALMGAAIGGAAAIVVLAFPRNHDYPDHGDDCFRD